MSLLQKLLHDTSKRPKEILREAERVRCERSLSHFIKSAWHVIEPSQIYVHGWHIDAICEHLEAVTNGDLKRLLITIPPGTMKSLITGVFWPAWEWGPKGMPSKRYVAASHSLRLSTRDNLRMRRLVSSKWYQSHWPVPLTKDQNEKLKFENKETGFREAMAMASMTGSRGDRVILDDPHSVEGALSEAARQTDLREFRETVPTRLNDPLRSAIIAIMQRIEQGDIAGVILSEELGYEHLMLPMEFEPERRCSTSIGFTDPRKVEGELLFPERFPREVVERDKKVMGSHAVAGQFQQRPAPRGGALFKTEAIEIVDAAPANMVECRAWDLAGTKGDNDFTAGPRMGRSPDGIYYIGNLVHFQGSPLQVENAVFNTASQDGKGVRIRIPQDPGQAGKAQAQSFVRKLSGYIVKTVRPTGDKIVRASPLAAQIEAGNVKLVRGSWNKTLLDEFSMFPYGKHDDIVDAVSDAFDELSENQTLRIRYA